MNIIGGGKTGKTIEKKRPKTARSKTEEGGGGKKRNKIG